MAAQSRVEVEHIVVDACSTDGTVEYLKEQPHLRWISEPDSGMSEGINKGFQMATGDWVMWLNADDTLLDNALKRVQDFAAINPEADVIYGGWRFVDKVGAPLKDMRLFPIDLGMLIYGGCYIGSTACFFRRATTIGEGFLLHQDFRQVMDLEYYLRLLKAGKRFTYLPELLSTFRLHDENSSMKDFHGRSLPQLVRQHRLWAETIALRRYYGWTPIPQ